MKKRFYAVNGGDNLIGLVEASNASQAARRWHEHLSFTLATQTEMMRAMREELRIITEPLEPSEK